MESIGRFRAGDYSVSVNHFSDFCVVFNERQGTVFADPAARKAVAQALDRTAFDKVASRAQGN